MRADGLLTDVTHQLPLARQNQENVMKNKWFTWMIGLLLIAGISIIAMGIAMRVVNARSVHTVQPTTVTLASAAQNQPAQEDATQLAGAYSGSVKLNATVAGVYSDTLATPPPPG